MSGWSAENAKRAYLQALKMVIATTTTPINSYTLNLLYTFKIPLSN